MTGKRLFVLVLLVAALVLLCFGAAAATGFPTDSHPWNAHELAYVGLALWVAAEIVERLP